jgi:hypothetical protein
MAAGDDEDPVIEVRAKWAVFGDFRAILPVAVMLVVSPVWLLLVLVPKSLWSLFWIAMSLGPLVLLALWLLGHLLPMRLRVGNDGVKLGWLLGWSRFIPFREVTSLRALKRDRKSLFGYQVVQSGEPVGLIELVVNGKERLRLLVGAPPHLVSRIESGIAEARADADRVLETRLSRRGRPVDEWLGAALREASGEDYRAGSIGRDRLLQTATHTAAAPTARVAAAAALRNLSLDDEERVRIRVAAASSLAPGVREALEAAAEAEAAEAEVTSLAARVRES